MLGKRIYLKFAKFSIANRAKVGVAGQFQVWPPLNSRFPYVYACDFNGKVTLGLEHRRTGTCFSGGAGPEIALLHRLLPC